MMKTFTKQSSAPACGALIAALLGVASIWPTTVSAQALDAPTATAIDSALAGPQRSDANKARDQYRHPTETLAFFGLRRDMTVVEIWPGGGWYTEILAPVLKETGKLYAAQYGPHAIAEYQRKEDAALRDKVTRFPDKLDAVQLTTLWPPEDVVIAPPSSADLVVTFRNVHNWVNSDYKLDASKFFDAFFAALKPGGLLGVVDHRWPDAKTEDPNATNGYVSEERIVQLAQAAGFELAGRSDVNRNPVDTHDHPNGVWTLPPDVAVGPGEDRQKYLAIGESDRLTLKFRKPNSR